MTGFWTISPVAPPRHEMLAGRFLLNLNADAEWRGWTPSRHRCLHAGWSVWTRQRVAATRLPVRLTSIRKSYICCTTHNQWWLGEGPKPPTGRWGGRCNPPPSRTILKTNNANDNSVHCSNNKFKCTIVRCYNYLHCTLLLVFEILNFWVICKSIFWAEGGGSTLPPSPTLTAPNN